MKKNFLTKNKITLNQLVEMWEKNRDTHVLAECFGVGSRTIRKALNRAGIYGKPGCYKGVKRRDHGAVERWLKDHPGIPLPTNRKEVRELTGLSRDVVNSYFIYRRKKIKKSLKRLEIKKDAVFFLPGRKVSFADVHLYRVRGNYRTEVVEITAYLKDEVVEIKTSIAKLKEKGYIK